MALLLIDDAHSYSCCGTFVLPVSALLFRSRLWTRSGGNVTGATFLSVELGAKRLELLRDLAPKIASIGLLVNPNNPNAAAQAKEIVALALRHSTPAIYYAREFAAAGGLISYASSFVDSFHQAATYVGRILNGEKPADLPVQQPIKFELVINRQAAKALGLTIPDKLLVAADEVIE